MARNKIQVIQFRRKREGKTDYRRRLKLLLAGKPRLVIRKSLNSIWLQVVEYSPAGDKIILSSHSNELKKLGWKMSCKNIPAAYLTGYLLGKKAGGKKIGDCILDMGRYTSIKGNKIYAALKGAVDGGVKVAFSKEILPGDERVKGKHIADFLKKAGGEKGRYGCQFLAYQKSSISPENIATQFDDTKQKIEGKKDGR